MLREASSNFLEDRFSPQSHPSPIKPSHLHIHSPGAAIPSAHANLISGIDTQYKKLTGLEQCGGTHCKSREVVVMEVGMGGGW